MALESVPGHSAAVLVALARIAGWPSATRVGKEIRLPPPATELTMPATSAATKRPRKPSTLIPILSRTPGRGRLPAPEPAVRAHAGRAPILRQNRCRRVAYNGPANAPCPAWFFSPIRRGNQRSRGGRTDAQVARSGRPGRPGVPRPGGATGNATSPAGRAGRSACRPGQPVLRRVDDAVRHAAVRRDRGGALHARVHGGNHPRARRTAACRTASSTRRRTGWPGRQALRPARPAGLVALPVAPPGRGTPGRPGRPERATCASVRPPRER